ncbi:MAG: acetylxylan esterase [Candidatus Solibacter usitatus]|nr:acetylxylan esterase [Candidatus Solibacter usitatus]
MSMMNHICTALLFTAFAQSPKDANYDESKVGNYTLPDPLKLHNGQAVTAADIWRAQRRPELLRLFATHMYGNSAPKPAKIEYEVTTRAAKALGGAGMRREITVWLTGKRPGPSMQLLVLLPAAAKGPSPVFLGPNFGGNHAISADPGITLAKSWLRPGKGVENNRATKDGRGGEASRWQAEMVLKQGYALATIHYSEIFPDHKDGLGDSIIPKLYRDGQTSQEPDDWGAIGAWAWALSRALDYIEKDKDLDARRVAVLGHSRLGKTSLWAGAQDERFSIVISNDSGEGGAALARRNFGETVERINTSFPWWFNANFKSYNKRVEHLPFDQHMLLALIAPRPLYVASAQEDLWADPRGEFLAAKAADPVYRMLGTDGLPAKEMPSVNQPVHGTIGYHMRSGKHDVTAYDWEQYLAFARKHWGR